MTLFFVVLGLFVLTWSIPALRRVCYIKPIFQAMRRNLPSISQTEREALDAGGVWWEAELFTGKPDWQKLQAIPAPLLKGEERAFLDGPVDTLCRMLNDWDITHIRRDLPNEVWEFIKQHKFFGMIIPKQYGGLEFSEFAHSQVVMKISSRSTSAAVTVMVPNSLGPAKLLLVYGTQQQKDYYLPRLADGREIPAFALTGPEAGSDAGAIPDTGVVCYSDFQDRKHILGIRLNWEKRYITLGPVATVLGMAFKLYDPDGLLGTTKNLGITLALIPTNTAGVSIGRRHFPLDSAFQNGPNWGKDVFIPMDWVIGGIEYAGQGWRMLMECLATGRAISLPALSVGAAKSVARNTGAYARIRTQFKLPIGKFEGIEEVLARMAGMTYLMDAARHITCAALDSGEKPAIISAILKYHLTESMRRIINDGMDIQGGSGICLGPSNYLGRFYEVIPVGITVEGANILTRTMMIFGQGSIRCHPFVQKEIEVLYSGDKTQALARFDRLILRHIAFFLTNLGKGLCLGLGGSVFFKTPGTSYTRTYYRQLFRLSVCFALATDLALITLGGRLKRKERISGRFADVLSYLYFASCALKHYEHQGSPEDDSVLLDWACQFSLYRAQQSLLAIFRLLPSRLPTLLLRSFLFPLGKPYSPPKDELMSAQAGILLTDNPARDRLTAGIYINMDPMDATGRIETAFKAILEAAPIEEKIRSAQKQKILAQETLQNLIASAVENRVINAEEAALLNHAENCRRNAIKVDDFAPHELNVAKII